MARDKTELQALKKAYAKCPAGHVLAETSSLGYTHDYEDFSYTIVNADGTDGETFKNLTDTKWAVRTRNWVYVPTAAIEKQHAEEAEDEARRNHEQNEEERILTAMRKLPGYSEYREINPSPVAMSIAEQEKEERQFKRMMEDGDNDGAYWPGQKKTTPAERDQIDENEALRVKYPQSYEYLSSFDMAIREGEPIDLADEMARQRSGIELPE